MGRSSACADASSAPFDEENTVPAGGRAAERPWNRIHSASEAAQRDLSVNHALIVSGLVGAKAFDTLVDFVDDFL